MENSIMNAFPIDPGILLLILTALCITMTVTTILCAFQFRRLYRRYDVFMRGKDAETLEDTIMDLVDESEELKRGNRDNQLTMYDALNKVKVSYQKTGIVKYNAFKGMGGELSFAIALLDDTNSGFILNSVHSRDGCYLYLKDVDEGKTEVLLGNEEKEALEQALGYIPRPGRSNLRVVKEKDNA